MQADDIAVLPGVDEDQDAEDRARLPTFITGDDPEGTSDASNGSEGDVLDQTSLDLGDLGSADAGPIRDVLLPEPIVDPDFANEATETEILHG